MQDLKINSIVLSDKNDMHDVQIISIFYHTKVEEYTFTTLLFD